MTYRVRRTFSGYAAGDLITDPSWPAQNLKALVSQQFLVAVDPPKPEPSSASKPAKTGRRES